MSPFDEARYARLMEGLEISEILWSKAYSAHKDFRLDPEFYSQDNLRKEDAVKKLANKPLSNLCKLIAGPFGSAITADKYDPSSKYRYIRATDIQSFFINQNSPIFLEENTFKAFPQFHLQENDILLTVVGMNFGKPAIIHKSDCPAIFSCKSTLIRNPVLNPWYLLTYLSCSIGHGLIRRGQRGAAQPGINLSDIETVLVPIVSDIFQKKVEAVIKHCQSLLAKSLEVYNSAEKLLFADLGMTGFSPNEESINVIKFNDSFCFTGRLDSEYYQPKYEEYLKYIIGYPNGWQLLESVCRLKDDNFTPVDSTAYKYIELSDVDNAGCITALVETEGRGLPSRARRRVEARDVLISSVEGSLASCGIVPEELSGALCSTGFYIINSEYINPETLLVLFKSPLLQNLLKQRCSGTILTAINKSEFQNLPIPMISSVTQLQLAALVQESIALRVESERLLEVAKCAVEIAIDQDEESAFVYFGTNA